MMTSSSNESMTGPSVPDVSVTSSTASNLGIATLNGDGSPGVIVAARPITKIWQGPKQRYKRLAHQLPETDENTISNPPTSSVKTEALCHNPNRDRPPTSTDTKHGVRSTGGARGRASVDEKGGGSFHTGAANQRASGTNRLLSGDMDAIDVASSSGYDSGQSPGWEERGGFADMEGTSSNQPSLNDGQDLSKLFAVHPASSSSFVKTKAPLIPLVTRTSFAELEAEAAMQCARIIAKEQQELFDSSSLESQQFDRDSKKRCPVDMSRTRSEVVRKKWAEQQIQVRAAMTSEELQKSHGVVLDGDDHFRPLYHSGMDTTQNTDRASMAEQSYSADSIPTPSDSNTTVGLDLTTSHTKEGTAKPCDPNVAVTSSTASNLGNAAFNSDRSPGVPVTARSFTKMRQGPKQRYKSLAHQLPETGENTTTSSHTSSMKVEVFCNSPAADWPSTSADMQHAAASKDGARGRVVVDENVGGGFDPGASNRRVSGTSRLHSGDVDADDAALPLGSGYDTGQFPAWEERGLTNLEGTASDHSSSSDGQGLSKKSVHPASSSSIVSVKVEATLLPPVTRPSLAELEAKAVMQCARIIAKEQQEFCAGSSLELELYDHNPKKRCRANMSPTRLEVVRKKQAERQRQVRAAMTPEELQKFREKQAAQKRMKRASLSPESLSKVREEQAARKRKAYASMTPEQLAEFREKQAARKRQAYAAMTPEKLKKFREIQVERKRKARSEMTEEQLQEFREKQAAQKREARAKMSPEQQVKFREDQADRQRKMRASLPAEELEILREKQAAEKRERRLKAKIMESVMKLAETITTAQTQGVSPLIVPTDIKPLMTPLAVNPLLVPVDPVTFASSAEETGSTEM